MKTRKYPLEAGSRVVVVSAVGKRFLGYGTHQGQHKHPHYNPFTLPKILLDSGMEIWGCDCWWGTKEQMIDAQFLPDKVRQEIARTEDHHVRAS